MSEQPAERALTTMASPIIVPKDAPFSDRLLFVVVALLIGLACFAGLLALVAAVAPRSTERCRAVLSRWPWATLLSGLVVVGAGGSLAGYLLSLGYVPRLLGVEIDPVPLAAGLALVTALMAIAACGAAGVAAFLGGRLLAPAQEEAAPLRRILVGSLVMVLSSWFPVVGWAIVMPGMILMSCGAPPVAWWRRRQLAEPPRVREGV